MLLANTPAMLECHYGVPMTGGVLNTLNTRLDAATIAFSLDHARGEDPDRRQGVLEAREGRAGADARVRSRSSSTTSTPSSRSRASASATIDYEQFLASGDAGFDWLWPADEWDAISLNYTSGTTGNPKGVVYHHRGAYLLAQGNVLTASMPKHPVYLWTLPMFHCNGWCFPWSISVVGGTHVTLRWVRSKLIWEALAEHKVTHLCGAPIVMSTILNAPAGGKAPADPEGRVLHRRRAAARGGARRHGGGGLQRHPSLRPHRNLRPRRGQRLEADWDAARRPARAAKKARQGVRYHALEDLDRDGSRNHAARARRWRDHGRGDVPRQHRDEGLSQEPQGDGAKPSAAAGSTRAISGVLHPDGYIQLKDRSKDIIISGGENISSIEVEDVLYKHPAVQAAAVVAKPDEKWGETPCAFVELKPGKTATAEEIIAWCREGLAHYKAPRHVVFTELPKTSTGKIQKFKLRDLAKGV